MEWLQSKVKLVEAALKNTNINVVSSATSATYVQSESMKSENEGGLVFSIFTIYILIFFYRKIFHVTDSYLKYAFGIVSEYLNPELAKNLSEKFGFKPDEIPTLSNKRKSLTEFNAESNIKKPKIEKNNVTTKETENEIPVKKIENKKTELTTKEKQRLKAASGTRNISSFFTKK